MRPTLQGLPCTVGVGDEVPQADTQKSIFTFLSDSSAQDDPYVIPVLLEISGDLDERRFESACRRLAARHEALRTAFLGGPAPTQVVLPVGTLDYARETPSGPRAESRAVALAQAEWHRGFVLGGAGEPVFRVRLYPIAADQCMVLLLFHHLTLDGWSVGTALRELDALYLSHEQEQEQEQEQEHEQERGNGLAPHQYRDFIAWQAAESSGVAFDRHREFWAARLEGFTASGSLTTASAEGTGDFTARRLPVTVPAGLQAEVLRTGRSTGTTAYLTHAAAWSLALADVFGEQSFLLAAPIALRSRPGWADMLGDLTNMLPTPVSLAPGAAAAALVGELRRWHYPALSHTAVHYGRMLADLGSPPTYHVRIGYHNEPAAVARLGDLRLRRVELADEPVTRRPVALELDAAGPEPTGYILYRSALFTRLDIETLGEVYLRRLTRAAVG